jgi:hypothetical protein
MPRGSNDAPPNREREELMGLNRTPLFVGIEIHGRLVEWYD